MSYTSDDLKSIADANLEYEYSETGGLYLPRSVTSSWRIIPPIHTDTSTLRMLHRLNSLGDLFYFATRVLGKSRFQQNPDPAKNLHYQMCKVVQKDGLKEVIEIPRGHFKSTVFTECYSMWRALPFTLEDELYMRALGYGDRWIQWMKYCHNQDIRILLVSEVITNASKLGVRLQGHYQNNDIFKYLFPEILPDASCTQNKESFCQMRKKGSPAQGEGTFDFIGVGGALQSRHYDIVIQDDLVGREAYESDITMAKTIEYHKYLVGAFDAEQDDGGRDNDELVVGNRWSYKDLNSYLRKEETYFNFTTHSALGGCCSLHPFGTPIFPESFNFEKLARYRKRLGTYIFSCQYLNTPINPAEVKFKLKDLRRYEFVRDFSFSYTDTKLFDTSGKTRTNYKVKIHHKVLEGDVEEDISPRNLKRYLIVDPNHSGNEGRCRHAITLTGIAENPRRVYLLDVWAKSCGTDEFIETMLDMAIRWKMDTIYMETIAAQKYLKYHIDYILKEKGQNDERLRNITIKELKTPKTANAKKMRIEGLGPIFARGEFWLNTAGMSEFIEEFEAYPSGKLIDVLDTLGYGPQVWDFDTNTDDIEFEILRRKEQYRRNIKNSSVGLYQ